MRLKLNYDIYKELTSVEKKQYDITFGGDKFFDLYSFFGLLFFLIIFETLFFTAGYNIVLYNTIYTIMIVILVLVVLDIVFLFRKIKQLKNWIPERVKGKFLGRKVRLFNV